MRRLTNLLDRTGAKVVLTSSWRLDPIGRLAVKYWGIPFSDVCPDKPRSPRRQEVLSCLSAHPRVTRFAVIDEEDDELDTLPGLGKNLSVWPPRSAQAEEGYHDDEPKD